MRILLASSRKAKGPITRYLGRQQRTCEQISSSQAGWQATIKGDIVRGFPARYTLFLQPLLVWA